MRQLKHLLASIGFLSIVPIGSSAKSASDELARAAAYFPVTGLFIGAIGMSLTAALDQVLPGPATNALIVLYLVVITGGFHLDALADTIDGFVGGKNVKQRLSIMREGASGPIGVAAVTLTLLLKFTFLNSLTGSFRLLAILTVPALARWPMVWLAWRLPAVRRSGLGFVFAGRIGKIDVIGAGLTTGLICAYLSFLLGPLILVLLPVLALLAMGYTWVNDALIGGVTGDTLGATVELTEVILLLAIGLLAAYA